MRRCVRKVKAKNKRVRNPYAICRARIKNSPKKKWGKIGAPKSAKRKRYLASIRKGKKRKPRRYKGYKSRRSFIADRKKQAKHRPRKKYKKGLGSQGDWARKSW